jgi:hypothetical protein
MMIRKLFSMAILLVVGTTAYCEESPPFPKGLPPMIGTAVVTDPGTGDNQRPWTIRLTIPKFRWHEVGKVIPKVQWSKLVTDIEKDEINMLIDGPLQLESSRVYDLEGKRLSREEVIRKMSKETPVLVSFGFPEKYYLQLTKPDALVIVLGGREWHLLEHYPRPKDEPAPPAAPAKE